MHLSCVRISSISKSTKSSFHLSIVTKEYHRVRLKRFWAFGTFDAKPSTYLASTINTVSKCTETRFHTTNVTKEIHRVRPNRFLGLWYIQLKPCTYLSSMLELYPNGPNRASTWASSPRSTIGCIQDDFWTNGMFGANVTYLTLSPNRPKWYSTWPTSPRSSIGCVQNNFQAYGTFGVNHALFLRQD